jgi:hypothetical protein
MSGRDPWEVNWEDYYRILGLDSSAEPEVIKAAYQSLAKKYHPDRNKNPRAEEFMKKLNEAYEILSNRESKERYDREHAKRKASPQGESAYHKAGAPEDRDSKGGKSYTFSSTAHRPRWQAASFEAQGGADPRSVERNRAYRRNEFRDEEGSQMVRTRGIFSGKTWPWEVAGLVVSVIAGVFLVTLSLAIKDGYFVVPFVAGLLMLTVSTYSAYRSDWLRDTRAMSLPVKLAAGACVILGWVWLVMGLLYAIILTIFMAVAVLLVIGLLLRSLFGKK